jgi:hypothetical protein
MGNAYYSCDYDSLLIERIIGVAASVKSVKRGPVVGIQRQTEPDALWQVGIREEISSKGHQIRIAISNSSLRYAAKLVRWPWTPALQYSSTTALFRSLSD